MEIVSSAQSILEPYSLLPTAFPVQEPNSYIPLLSFAGKDADLGMDTIWDRALEKLRMEIHKLLSSGTSHWFRGNI